MNYEQITRLTRGRNIRWKDLIAYVVEEGIRDGEGKVPTADRMSTTWRKVKAARGKERRKTGQVPPSRETASQSTPARDTVRDGTEPEPPARPIGAVVVNSGSRGACEAAPAPATSAVSAAGVTASMVEPAAAREIVGPRPTQRPPPDKLALETAGEDRTDEQVAQIKVNTLKQGDFQDRGSGPAWNRKKMAEEDAAGVKRM